MFYLLLSRVAKMTDNAVVWITDVNFAKFAVGYWFGYGYFHYPQKN